MKYLFIFLIVLVMGAAGYLFYVREGRMLEVTMPTNNQATTTDSPKTPEASSSTAVQSTKNTKTYENKTWGLRFEYPNEWDAHESTFRAASSLFNIVLQPIGNNHLPDPIIISITNADWGQTLFDRAPGNNGFENLVIASYTGVVYDSIDMGLPTKVYLFKTDSDFWITIIGKEGYEDSLNQVLESLVITPVTVDAVRQQ